MLPRFLARKPTLLACGNLIEAGVGHANLGCFGSQAELSIRFGQWLVLGGKRILQIMGFSAMTCRNRSLNSGHFLHTLARHIAASNLAVSVTVLSPFTVCIAVAFALKSYPAVFVGVSE